MMDRLVLQRDPFKVGLPTTGRLIAVNGTGRTELCKTLELPWMNNAKGASCIPAGHYRLVLAHSPRYGRDMWRVMGVPGRDGILIHSANYIRQLRGCIAPGLSLGDIDKDGKVDAIASAAAMLKLNEALMDYQPVGVDLIVLNA